MILKNSSQVKAVFRIQEIATHEYKDSVFQVDCHQGEILPNQSFQIIITYKYPKI